MSDHDHMAGEAFRNRNLDFKWRQDCDGNWNGIGEGKCSIQIEGESDGGFSWTAFLPTVMRGDDERDLEEGYEDTWVEAAAKAIAWLEKQMDGVDLDELLWERQREKAIWRDLEGWDE